MMTKARVFWAVVAIGIAALLAVMFVPASRSGPQKMLAADYQPAKGAGLAVARAADCVACHTAPGGKPFAGGLKIESPFGPIYSSNITPDKQAGIGNYTLDDFRAALVDGVRKDGVRLYPAMPYPSYRKMSEEDIRALYAYIMGEVAPVAATANVTQLSFPFNQRWGIRLWNWVSLPKVGFDAQMSDAKLNRGAYLVEALAHCGACHTPRDNLTQGEKGYDSRASQFLAGGTVGAWTAPDLRAKDSATQRWSKEDLAALFSTGRNATSAVSGEMALAVEHSLQYLPQADIDAIVDYLKSISQDRQAVNPPRATPAPTAARLTEAKQLELGERLYLDNCNACHFVNGRGAPNVFPHLDGNSLVTAPSAAGLVNVILNGAAVPSTEKRPLRLVMPGMGWRLKDDEVAALASFLRQAWTNNAPAVSAAEVKTVRDSSK